MLIPRTFFIAALLSLFVLPSSALAQSGRIVGTVVDAGTGESLPGANVLIQGTSTGAAADIDGEFTIPNVPAGTHMLVASYVGYNRQTLEVQVEPGEEVEVNIAMTWAGVEGEEVIITAQARGQTQAINEQISAMTIKNVVSAERIRELPDEDAATAISRLPGISLQEGDKIVVRGIQAKMNTVTVNGIQLPSTDLEDRSTSLGFISSNMLSGIEVTKAVTPAMDANSIGGTVNLRLREAPEGWHYDTMLQGDYNGQDRTYQNYRAWASVSNRFFGDRLGAFLQGNARRFDGGQDFVNVNFAGTGPDPGYGQRMYGATEYSFSDQVNITEEYGGSLMLDYRLPNGKLVMQNTYAAETNDYTTHIERLFLQTRQRDFRVERDINDRYLLINALQGEHEISDLTIDWGISHARSQKKTDLNYGLDFTPRPNAWEDAFSQEERVTLDPETVFGLEMNPDWTAPTAGNGATRDEYFFERRLNGTLNLTLPVTFSNSISGFFQAGGKIEQLSRENDVTRYFARLSEGGRNVLAADFINSLCYTNEDGEEICGDHTEALSFALFENRDYERGQYFLDERREMNRVIDTDYMDTYMRVAPPGWNNGLPHQADSYRFDYIADERLSAAYAMANFNIGPRLNVLTGVRYENFHMDYEAPFVYQSHFDGQGSARDTLKVDRSTDHWFPNLQIRYNVTDWFDVRLAYTKTLSRPDYQQLLPNTFVDRGNSPASGVAGNPFLEPTVSQNYDAYLSFYHNRIGLFTVGGFIKDMEDVILQQDIRRRHLNTEEGEEPLYEGIYWAPVLWPDAGYPDIDDQHFVTTFLNNRNPAIIRGLEFDWQTNFWYLPRPLNSLVFNVNYTRTYSEMDYYQVRDERVPLDPGNPFTRYDYVPRDTVRTARLLYQGDNVINIALGADVGGFSGRISFRFQGDVITNVSEIRPEEDAFTENIYTWDFSIRQALPLDGLTLFLNGLNITHSPENAYRYYPNEAGREPSEHISRIAYNPRRFQLGVRYTY